MEALGFIFLLMLVPLGILARRKGRGVTSWVLLGVLISAPVALLCLVFVPSLLGNPAANGELGG
jgi:hypothetical protein